MNQYNINVFFSCSSNLSSLTFTIIAKKKQKKKQDKSHNGFECCSCDVAAKKFRIHQVFVFRCVATIWPADVARAQKLWHHFNEFNVSEFKTCCHHLSTIYSFFERNSLQCTIKKVFFLFLLHLLLRYNIDINIYLLFRNANSLSNWLLARKPVSLSDHLLPCLTL